MAWTEKQFAALATAPTGRDWVKPMWLLIQSLVIFAVVASNIHWGWTPNKLVPAALGIGLAFLLTACWNGLREHRLQRAGSKQEFRSGGQTVDDGGREARRDLLGKG